MITKNYSRIQEALHEGPTRIYPHRADGRRRHRCDLIRRAIPIYTDNARKTRVQEAVDTIGAIKDEITSIFSEDGILPPRCDNHNQIRDTIGVQVPESGKWTYRIRENGVIFVRARASLGRSLMGGWIRCTPQVDWNGKAITSWRWRCDGRRVKPSYLPG